MRTLYIDNANDFVWENQDEVYIILNQGTGDTFNALLFLFRKPPVIKWHIIAPAYQKKIIDLFLETLEITKNTNCRLETITYLYNSTRSLDPVVISNNHNYGELDAIQSYIEEAGIYYGWVQPDDYLITFNERNYKDGLKWISLLNKTSSSTNLLGKKLLIIYPESGMLSKINKDFWLKTIEILAQLIGNEYHIVLNKNPESTHDDEKDIIRNIKSTNFRVLDLGINSIISLANLNCEITILGFRSGIHDMTRWIKQCRLIELYLPGSSKIDVFNLTKLSSLTPYVTIQLSEHDVQDPQLLTELVLDSLKKLELISINNEF